MGESLRRFVPRAPRYILRTQDRNIMRFGLSSLRGPAHIEQTTLLNLSETGAAFVTDETSDIKIGDSIKVEIPIPSGDQIAWFARVVRIQEYDERAWWQSGGADARQGQILIALRFDELPAPHTRAIRKGIEASFLKALQDQQVRKMLYYKAWLTQNLLPIIGYTLLTAAAIGFIYMMTRPSANYDEKRGAPWGERFKF